MSTAHPIRRVILGGGGHAKVLIDAIESSGETNGIGILDSNPALWGTKLLGQPILGSDELLPKLVSQGAREFVVGLGSVGDNGPRRRLFELALEHGLEPLTIVHPNAICSRYATVGAGSVVLPGVVVNAGVNLGINVIINSGSTIEHDCQIGDHVHIASGCTLCSAVQVDIGAHVGGGSTVRQGIKIGAEAIVGAGAVVVKDVAPATIVVGVPAHQLRG